MTKVEVTRISSKLNAQLSTTVEFLQKAREKGFVENVSLRNYLKSKHGLTSDQIDRAFTVVNKLSSGTEEVKKSGVWKELNQHEPNNFSKASEEHKKDNSPKLKRISNLDIGIASNDDYQSSGLSFLLAEKQVLGWKELQLFMDSEVTYCLILDSLLSEYYGALVNMTNKNKLMITPTEVEEMFEYIPDMLKFHRYTLSTQLLKCDENIGKIFLRHIKAFNFYIDYMKGCSSTVDKMGKYTNDKKLHRFLRSLQKKSTYRSNDMFDLLIAPLERIGEYKLFLDTLLNWADKSRQGDYELISKAARRVRAVVEYIERYKHGIINKNEMNKVQQFVKDSNFVIAKPKRKILRRGVMKRYFAGWSTRNRTYIFFLFNDVIFWTSKKGDIQSVLLLQCCAILDSDSKHNPKRKMKLVYQDAKKRKTFDLECTNEQQRKQWFNALSNAISKVKVNHKYSVTSKLENEKSDESLSSESIPQISISRASLSGCGSPNNRSEGFDFRLGDCDETGENTGWGPYEYSRNFELHDNKDFHPKDDAIDFEIRDDTVSTSELDYINWDGKLDKLLDFRSKSDNSSKLNIQIGNISKERLTKITEEYDHEVDKEVDSNNRVSVPVVLVQGQKRSRVIRRGHLNDSLNKFPSSTLESKSNLTIRLNDFAQELEI